MKIARYFFQQLFKIVVRIAHFNGRIFNPKMIQLLFQEEISNMQLTIHSQEAYCLLSANSYDPLDILTFAFNHLVSNKLVVDYRFERKIEENINILLEILSKGGNKFSAVCCNEVSKFVYKTVMEVNVVVVWKSPLFSFLFFPIFSHSMANYLRFERALRVKSNDIKINEI